MRLKRFVALPTMLFMGGLVSFVVSLASPQTPPSNHQTPTDTHVMQELSNELAQLIASTRVCVVTIHGWAQPPHMPPFPYAPGDAAGGFLYFSGGPPPPPKEQGFKPPFRSKAHNAEHDLSAPSASFALLFNNLPVRLTGSGFFIRKNLVVTTAEVAGNMVHPIVITDAGKWVPAVGMNVDFKNNVAVLQLSDDTATSTLTWGKANAVIPGNLVIIFGNQAGFSQMPTLGMVTACNQWARSPDGRFHYNDLLQLQGAIGPGASGAPVIDAQAHVVGMVVGAFNGPPMDFSHPPAFPPGAPPNGGGPFDFMLGKVTNIGFALPADHLETVVEKLSENIRPLPPLGWFGFIPGRADEHGIQIDTVFVGGPADVAGLRPGDWITEIDGRPLRSRFEIPALSETLPVGQKLDVRAERNGKPFHTTLTVQPRPNDQQLLQMQRLSLPHEEKGIGMERPHQGQQPRKPSQP